MDKEVSNVVHLSVTLMLLSALITLVMYTVNVGNNFKSESAEKMVSIASDTSTGQLNSLAGGETKVMPKASIYYILSKEYVGINSLYYTFKNTEGIIVGGWYTRNKNGYWAVEGVAESKYVYISPENIINENSLDGKVSVIVERVSSGIFNIIIKEESLYD